MNPAAMAANPLPELPSHPASPGDRVKVVRPRLRLRALHLDPAALATRGRNKGRVAVARKLLTLVYYGLRDGQIRCLRADREAA